MLDFQSATLREALSPLFSDEAPSGHIAIDDPSTGRVIAAVRPTDVGAIDEAIARAERAQRDWQKRTMRERAAFLMRVSRALGEASEDFAQLISLESGKPLREARDELEYSRSFFDYYAAIAGDERGAILPEERAGTFSSYRYGPIGVGAAITPWNFPLAMLARKLSPALLAGNSLLVKPAESTPLSAIALEAILREAGCPESLMINLLGDRESAARIGDALMRSTVVRKLSFTGSTAVGKSLLRASADTLKRVSLELGGNAPFLIFEDAALESAIDALLVAKFRNAGQTCVAAQRIYIHRSIYKRAVELLEAKVSALRLGPGLDKSSEVGPLIREAAREKVERHLADAIARGATLVSGGERAFDEGYFFEPTVIKDFADDALLTREESFGPLLAVRAFEHDDEAIAHANRTRSGLVAYAFTENLSRAHRLSESLDFGMVRLNTGHGSSAVSPFFGIKESGLGVEASKLGLLEWMAPKTTTIGGL